MLSFLKKKWCLEGVSPEKVLALVQELNIPHTLAILLMNRGAGTADEVKTFLQADLSLLHDPFLMAGMDRAVERVICAIESKEAITVFCDYDVDGVTSAAFLTHFSRDLKNPVSAYLPERKAEGYGLNADAIRKISEQGSTLMITADCGITGVREVALANELGLDVIVTDHHQVGEEGLPNAVAVLNPHRDECNYPFRFLSGVGLAFKLAIAIRSKLHSAGRKKEDLPNLKRHLDLFALGTIADVAPLTGENHILTKYGLDVLTTSAKPGLVALKEVAGIVGNVDARSVGFGLGPRLNAAGRLGKADNGLHLLTATELPEAKVLANELEKTNIERKEIQEETFLEAELLLLSERSWENRRVIVLASEIFHPGVIGIAASKMVEKYHRPTVLIAMEKEIGKGSGRSIPKFNLFKAFTNCSNHLVQFGGHAYAAGLTIEEKSISLFRDAINEVGHQYLKDEDLIPEIRIDTTLDLSQVDFELYRNISLLEPFGAENPTPSFQSNKIKIRELKFIGKEKNHVRFKALQEGAQIEVVAFNFADIFKSIDTLNEVYDISYELHLNSWNGREKLELRLLDIRAMD